MSNKPICPKCGRRLVFVAMAVPGIVFHTWQCDCTYREEESLWTPPEIVGDICRAREWDDGSIVYDIVRGMELKDEQA